MKIFTALIVIVILAIGSLLFSRLQTKSSTPQSVTEKPQSAEENKPAIEVIAKNLEVPWALAFLPDQTMIFTERAGKVKILDNQGNISEINQIAEVHQAGESGLHGITVHPDFDKNHFVYLYYTYQSDSGNTLNRVSRFKFEDNTLKNQQVIVDNIPGAVSHDGGRIKFGPDGFLYITTGDAQNPSLSQDRNSLAGKILRVNDEGKPAPGNPFNTPIFSYGHRNPQGITWDNQGRLWETEHGQTATDEVNLIEAGRNFGWPEIRGDQKQTDMISPILQSADQTWAPAGAAYFKGSIFFAGLRGQTLFEVKLDTLKLKEHFKGQFGRIREVVLGPDNMLYITTSNRDGRGSPAPDDDKIIRINPQKL